MKNKVIRTILSSLLIVVMLFTAVPITASAATSGKCGDNLSWTFNQSTGELVISGEGEMYNERSWESYTDTIKFVTIGNGVTTIGDYAFWECINLTEITMPNTVTYIGNCAFCECDLLSDVYYYGTSEQWEQIYIDPYGDGNGNLPLEWANIHFLSEPISDACGDNLVWSFNESTGELSITGTGAMYDYSSEYSTPWYSYRSSIKTVTFSNGVTAIGDYAYCDCDSLTSVDIGNSVAVIGNCAFYDCDTLTVIDVPDKVTTIGDYAFYDCDSLSSVVIGDGVTTIGEDVFYWCRSLTSVAIGNSVSTIGSGAFAYCDNLKSVDIPDSVTIIEAEAFYNCDSLASVDIGNGVTTIGDRAFFFCSCITSITVDDANKYYSSDSYGVLYNKDKTELIKYPCGNQRTSFAIPTSVTAIGDDAFYDCDSLTSVDIPDGVIVIGDSAFGNCDSLTSATVPNSVTAIGEYAFGYCDNLTSVIIGNSVATIGDGTFSNCISLTSMKIPNRVTAIGDYAFYWCYNLTDVYYSSTQGQWNKISIGSENEYLKSANIHFLSEPETPTYTITYNANGGSNAPASQTKTEGVNIILSKSIPTRSGYTFLGWSTNKNATVAQYKPGATFSANTNTTLYAVWSKEEIYNLGEETYSFDNFGDSDSPGGHCFGMSITSSGYYLDELDVTDIGLNDSSELYTVSKTAKVKKPICYYQDIQGEYARRSVVAGGSIYNNSLNITSDWNKVVNYVKSGNYDDKGSMQILYWGYYYYGGQQAWGGHAVNFLRHESVNGQDRIYVYDNNFPNTETYFYEKNGYVYQAPYSTIDAQICSFALCSVSKYFDIVGGFDSTKVIYAYEGEIEIDGVEGLPMVGAAGERVKLMYEVGDNIDSVTITPLVDNAEFEYLNDVFAFNQVGENTCGVLKLANTDVGGIGGSANGQFTIMNKPNGEGIDEVFVYDLDMTYKSYAWIESEIYVTGNVDYTVEYSSSNPSVAYVDEFGEVYAAGEGSAEITCTVTDEYGNVVTDTCEVKVSYAWWQWIIRILLLGFLWY